MVFLLGAAAAGWLIYDMATANEAPSQTFAVMKYALLAILVTATGLLGSQVVDDGACAETKSTTPVEGPPP